MRVTINKHIAPVGYEWKLSSTWMGDKKIDCHRLYGPDMQDIGSVRRDKGTTYIDWDTGQVYANRTEAMLAVEKWVYMSDD